MGTSPELMPAVILAGGMATRLLPLTEAVPKALIVVAGQPFLTHQLLRLKAQGIRRVLLLVGHLGDMIARQFGDGSQLGLSLEYSFDGPVLLGTAGAIRRALRLLPERFFVLYGDSYLTCDFGAAARAFSQSEACALMTVYRNENRYDTSNVDFDGARIVRYDKRHRTPTMRHIDYGLGVFDRSVFAALPADTAYDLATVYQDLLAAGQLAAFEVHERFYEIGSHEGLHETERLLRREPRP